MDFDAFSMREEVDFLDGQVKFLVKCNVVPCKIEDKPFVFISYSHSDASSVFPVIEGIAAEGYNIWYDHGIEVNTTWSDEIANAIMESGALVVFVTKASMASGYVRAEVEFAFSKKIEVIPIYLESKNILPPGLSLTLHSQQGIESNDTETIISKLRSWLMRNFQQESWLPVQSSVFAVKKPSPVQTVSKTPEPAKSYRLAQEDEDDAPEEEGNYWGSGLLSNKEEYEKYLLIKNNLEGRPGRSPRRFRGGVHLVSFHPFLGLGVGILILIGVLNIGEAYLRMGLHPSSLVVFLREAVPLAVLYWYFFRRYVVRESFLERILPFSDKIQTMLYWLLLLGWMGATLNPEEFKFWMPRIAPALQWLGISADFANMELPAIPQWGQSLGLFSAIICGSILFFDMVVSFFTEKD